MYAVALLKMVALGTGFRGGALFRSKKQVKGKKNVFTAKSVGFRSKMRKGIKQSEKRKVFTANRWSYGFSS